MDEFEREELRKLMRELMVWREDFNEIQKELSGIENRFRELYLKVNSCLDNN